MKTLVEIENNPYKQELKILINGNPPSSFSRLDKFMKMPFLSWCDQIFSEIDKELNDSDYEMCFTSRPEEVRVMKKFAEEQDHCLRFYTKSWILNTPLTKRMAELSAFLKEKNIQNYPQTVVDALFIVDSEESDLVPELKQLSVKNRFCKINPNAVTLSQYLKERPRSDIQFFITDKNNWSSRLEKYGISDGFAIVIGEENEFKGRKQGVLIYETRLDHLYDELFECLQLQPLLDLFTGCIRSLPGSAVKHWKSEINRLVSITPTPVLNPKSSTIEAGKSLDLHLGSDVPGYEFDFHDLEFRCSDNNVIRCNGLQVFGLKKGQATLYVYRKGEKDVCAEYTFTVIVRNRVSELIIEENDLTIGEGNYYTLDWTYMPPEADNLENVFWESEDPHIASIDQDGRVKGVKSGETYIHLICEQVSTKMIVKVLPHISDIDVDTFPIMLTVGEKKTISAETIPSETIEGGIKMASLNTSIANVINHEISAFSPGNTVVVIQDKGGRIRKEITVTVLTQAQKKRKSFFSHFSKK